MNSKILLSSPHMGGTEEKYVAKAFRDNWIAPLGENVDKFEESIAEYTGAKGGASALSSGTAAIHLALRLLNVGKNDIVFAPSFTFIATVNPILYQGAIPVFIDSEPNTWNMSPIALENALEEAEENNQLPKAIIVVNLYGQMAKYSFNGNKIITTSGGGALVASDKKLVDHSRFLATQARDQAPYYQHSEIGYNYRLSNISAGVGRGQMEVLNERVARRRAIFDRYKEAFSGIESISMMPEVEDMVPNRWLSTLTIKNFNSIDQIVELIGKMSEKNIETRALWKPLHLQPVFYGTKMYYHDKGLSVSEKLFNSGLCLPSGTNMTDAEQEYVIEEFKKIIQ